MDTKIYTLDYCPYCKKALGFLSEKGVNFEQIRIDDDENFWFKKLKEEYNIAGEVTVPQIIINGDRIGGFDDMVKKYQAGELLF